MLLIDSLHVNNGGGKILLIYLIESIEKTDLSVVYLLDDRLKNVHLDIKSTNTVIYLKATLINRLNFYRQNKFRFKKIFCFGNIPPILKCDAIVYTYLHQKIYINIPSSTKVKERILFNLKSILFNYFLSNTNFIIVQSQIMKIELNKKYPKIINHNILVIPFYPKLDSSQYIEREANRYLYVSDGYDYKNHDRLLNAFCKFYIKYQVGELHLTIGEGNLKLLEKLERLKKDFPIINHGIIPRDELTEIYKKSSFVIFPSITESFGMGLIEGIHLGCNIMGADLSYTHAVCTPSLVFNPFDETSIFNALEKSLFKVKKSVLKSQDEIDNLVGLFYRRS